MSGLRRTLLVVAGIIVGQVILYGPSLFGAKILLPLDLLAQPNVYIPRDNVPCDREGRPIAPHNRIRSDIVFADVIYRDFAIKEFRSGRLPCWTPFQYGGSVLCWMKYSPFYWLDYCVESPVAIAWRQMIQVIVAGMGFYVFCRKILGVGYWPATLASWCYPMTGYFVFWQGYPAIGCVVWTPWVLLAVDGMVRRAGWRGGAGLAVVTCLVLISGPLDVAGQVLLTSGLYAVWCFIDEYGRECFGRRSVQAAAAVTSAWILGFLLAAPHLLPILEYSRTGSRMARRGQGEEERPPVGIVALPQTVLPDMYGTTQRGSLWMPPTDEKGRPLEGNQLESAAATYTGLLATMLAAPLAWCSRRHRSINIFWTVLAVFALGWCLDIPFIVGILRMPGLNMMSHNRFVFAASFAILAMAAIGLNELWQGSIQRQWWFMAWIALQAILLLWCVNRTLFLPDVLATDLKVMVESGRYPPGITNAAGVEQAQDIFRNAYGMASLLCILSFVGWLLLWFQGRWSSGFRTLVAGVLVADMLWFAYDRSAQCDPALYFPRIPALEEVAKSTPGRIIGYSCLPAILGQTHGLNDIRGYDAVDPAELMDLMGIAADPKTPMIPYALTQWFIPKIAVLRSGDIRLSPVLDMMGVRYVIFRGLPPRELPVSFSSLDYWVLTNQNAMPRVYVPLQVETISNKEERLTMLASTSFDPRKVAYVEQETSLPDKCQGTAKIVEEIPTRVTVSLDMKTAGLVVLADLWNSGWHAYYEGKAVPILRTNHAVRGVVAPAGKGTLEFRYEPASLAWGLGLCGLALLVLASWTAIGFWCWRRGGPGCQQVKASVAAG